MFKPVRDEKGNEALVDPDKVAAVEWTDVNHCVIIMDNRREIHMEIELESLKFQLFNQL